jgi:sporulation protein YlmC with PRC-barrel domain
MARQKLMTSNDFEKIRVLGGKKGTKRIGKVKTCVFHPREKRCIGFIVKRPDAAMMFHRKDIFVPLDGYDFANGRIVIHPDAEISGEAYCKKHGIDWDRCILWSGMPMISENGEELGYVGNMTFDVETGELISVVASNGATAKYLLGTLEVPASYVKGFRTGIGAELSIGGNAGGEEEEVFHGAILVSDDVWELEPEGGWAESAGEAVAKAKARAKDAAASVKPHTDAAVAAAGEAINKGAYATGKQIAASKGMFSAFKDEFQKGRAGEASELAEEADEPGMFAAFKQEFDKARGNESEEPEEDEYEDEDLEYEEDDIEEDDLDEDEDEEYDADDSEYEVDEYEDDEYEEEESEPKPAKPSARGMFAAFRDEYNKALNE